MRSTTAVSYTHLDVYKRQVQDRGLRQRWVGLVLVGPAPANAGDLLYAVADVEADRPTAALDSDANEEFDAERRG